MSRAYRPTVRVSLLAITDQDSNDIWIWDLARETLRRLTFAPGIDGLPLWTPDGRRIIFTSDRSPGVSNLYSQAADGTGTVERLTTSANPAVPDVHHAGRDTRRRLRERIHRRSQPGRRPVAAWRVRLYPPGGPLRARAPSWNPTPRLCSTEPGRSSRPTAATSRTSFR